AVCHLPSPLLMRATAVIPTLYPDGIAPGVIPCYTRCMPYSDPKKHRDYYRDHMRRRRAGKAAAKPKPADAAAVAKLEARIRELEDALTTERKRCKILEDGFRNLERQQRESKPPKAAKSPLPPDEQ